MSDGVVVSRVEKCASCFSLQEIPPTGGASMFLANYNSLIRFLYVAMRFLMQPEVLVQSYSLGLQPVLVRTDVVVDRDGSLSALSFPTLRPKSVD